MGMSLGRKLIVIAAAAGIGGLFLGAMTGMGDGGSSTAAPASSSSGDAMDRAWAANWARFTPTEHEALCAGFRADSSAMYRRVFPNYDAPITPSQFNTYMYQSCP